MKKKDNDQGKEENGKILLSVIMAAYNSEVTIERSLKSIREQRCPQDRIEVFVIDGGSEDKTREIARKYGCIVLDNPRRLPEYAKRIGLERAVGKYVLIMDSDEVIPNRKVFARRLKMMQEHPDIKCLLGGYRCPKGHPACGHYISNVGDPFTAFVYQWYYGGNIGLIRKNKITEDEIGYIGKFENTDLLPIGDSVTLMDRKFLMENYGDAVSTENTATLFQYILQDTHLLGHVKGDFVLHYTRSDMATYFRKLKFRVINNIFDIKGSGYAARAVKNKNMNRRKYMYPLYCVSVFMPIVDGVRMSRYYGHAIYLMHPIFAWYVMAEIVIQMGKKVLKLKSENEVYG